jgi:hypothetical protein
VMNIVNAIEEDCDNAHFQFRLHDVDAGLPLGSARHRNRIG